MNKLHTYMLPIAAGAFALMLSPLAETAAVAYSLIVIIVITGIVGLQVLAKNSEVTNKNNDLVVQNLDKLHSQIEILIQGSNKQAQLIEQQSAEQLAFAKDVKQHYITSIETMTEQSNSIIKQSKEQTIILNNNLEKVQSYIETLQQIMTNHLVAVEDKVDEGNKVLETVSILMVKELENNTNSIISSIDELISLQSTLPNEIYNLQDAISRNQEQLIDGTKDLESQLESLKDETTTYHEQSIASHQDIIYKVSEEFTKLSTAIQQETVLMIEQANSTTKVAADQLTKATELVQNIENINKELNELNETNNDKVDKQLIQLIDISSSLLQGIAQLTNSQSAERKQLLAIQKRLISKYSKV